LRFNNIGRAALLTPPYLVLHCEEFAWPHVLPRAPVRSYIKPRRTAPFHPSPFEISNLKSQISEKLSKTRGWSVFCCTCRRPYWIKSQIWDFFRWSRPAVSGLAAL